MPARVLVVEDDRNLCELLELGLGRRGFRVTWRLQAREAIELLEADDFDVVLADVNMPEIGGLELCRRVVEARRELPVVVITAFGSLETAVDAIRAGAYDFVTKPVELEVLALTLERAVAHRALRQEVRRLQDAALATRQRGDLVGGSPAMKAVYDLVDRVGASEASVAFRRASAEAPKRGTRVGLGSRFLCCASSAMASTRDSTTKASPGSLGLVNLRL